MSEITPLDLSEVLSKSKDNQFLTDITFDLGSKKLYAHKLILASVSDFFRGAFYGGYTSPDVIPVTRTDPVIFEMYIDYVYGKVLELRDWKTMMKLFKFIDYTQTTWDNKDQNIIELEVPTDDYIDYLHDLIELYHEEVPTEVLENSAEYIKGYVDLSKFTEDVIKVITHSDQFDPICRARREIYRNLESKGFNSDVIRPIEDKLTENPILSISHKEPLILRIISGAPALTWEDSQFGYAARGRATVKDASLCDLVPISIRYAPEVILVFNEHQILNKDDVVVITSYTQGFERIRGKKNDKLVPKSNIILVLDYKLYGY